MWEYAIDDGGFYVYAGIGATDLCVEEALSFAERLKQAAEKVLENRRRRWLLVPIKSEKKFGEMLAWKSGSFVDIMGDVAYMTPRQARRLARHIEQVCKQ